MRKMKDWRFRPAVVNRKPTLATGTLQLALTATGVPPFTEPGTGTTRGPDLQWQPKTAEEFVARGDEWLSLGKRSAAEADIDEALRLRPEFATAMFRHGYVESYVGNHGLAIADFDRVIQEKPDWPDVYRSRGDAYRYSGQAQKALEDIQKALALNPNSESVLRSLGRIYVDQERWDLAKTIFDRALELNPNSSWARQERSFALQKAGRCYGGAQ